ncbi:DUF3794 domain-containing protein [Sporomusa termitida]|uniref:SipL SPOCS domain-containing protein n=1 Tax=Sporomusa termitida TaxID=2377 RepID=A0A517DZM4_9FIRM|nr:DUF3794 domain-containing protein [Sporomusa termitida]QDR82807.1 hypothetical protein SPTER_42380 [Sporomusa termitida]
MNNYCDCKEGEESTVAVDGNVTKKFEKSLACGCEKNDHMLIINGVCSKDELQCFLDCGNIRRWTQVFIPEVLCIPCPKPDIEQLISISALVEILSQRVIRTPGEYGLPLTNEECTDITGRKLIIEGVLRQKIIYAAAVKEQSVHSVHFDVPFSAFIVLSPCDPLTRKFEIDVCIEDIFVTDIAPRKIFKNVSFVIRALPIMCPEICI